MRQELFLYQLAKISLFTYLFTLGISRVFLLCAFIYVTLSTSQRRDSELSSNLVNANNNIATINNKLISIVERGTKNNYNYTKYSNGDMVMWSKYTWNTNLATSWYNWYFASSAAVGFPVAFKETPLIIVSPAKTNELYGLGVTEVTTTGYKLTAYSPKQGMCYVQADMLIIGKWK